jgi:hypothetical protein
MQRRSIHPDADPFHACPDPIRCTRPFCATHVTVPLVTPQQARTVTRKILGWPVSASALFDSLNAQIIRHHLLAIADKDPFGAHAHFPILVRIRLSGRVPPRLSFDPGEALRLSRWGSGAHVDHLVRAWCCTILTVCPTDEYDQGDLTEVAAQLVASCFVLDGDAPALAERLFAWRAISDDPAEAARRPPSDDGHPDTVALLALFLLRAAADPTDARLGDLGRAVAGDNALPTALAESVSAPHWRDLLGQVLTRLRATRPDLTDLLGCLPR